jgi:excisionase family DNA binding protein
MTSVAEHKWLTVRETAEQVRVSEVTIRRAIARGELPAVQLGGPGSSIRIDEAELERWLLGEERET